MTIKVTNYSFYNVHGHAPVFSSKTICQNGKKGQVAIIMKKLGKCKATLLVTPASQFNTTATPSPPNPHLLQTA